jgi:hypothetical protein
MATVPSGFHVQLQIVDDDTEKRPDGEKIDYAAAIFG